MSRDVVYIVRKFFTLLAEPPPLRHERNGHPRRPSRCAAGGRSRLSSRSRTRGPRRRTLQQGSVRVGSRPRLGRPSGCSSSPATNKPLPGSVVCVPMLRTGASVSASNVCTRPLPASATHRRRSGSRAPIFGRTRRSPVTRQAARVNVNHSRRRSVWPGRLRDPYAECGAGEGVGVRRTLLRRARTQRRLCSFGEREWHARAQM